MRAEYAVREATPDDVAALVALEERVFATDRLDARAFRHAVRSASMALLVGDAPAGLGGYAIVEFRKGSEIARLTSLATAPASAGQGLGRRLLQSCEDAARSRGCRRMRLEVRADNARAAALYDRAGFRRLSAVPEYYEDGETALRFEKGIAG